MKKKLVLLVVLFIILIVAFAVTVIVVNKIDKNDKMQNNDTISIPPKENVVVEEFVKVLDNGIKQNISTKLKENKIVNGLEFSNIDFYMSNGQTVLQADLKNNSGKDIEITSINIIFIDKDGNETTSMLGILNPTKNGETTKFQTSTTLDFTNAYDFKIEIL